MDVRMERRKSAATKPRRKAGNKRKPLSDLSNTIPSSQPSSQSSSSSIKFKPKIRSSLSLALKSLPNNPNSKLTAIGSTTNINNNNEKTKESRKSPTYKANPSFSLSPSSETPCVSVYGRQHTAEKRKEIAEPLSCIFETRIPDLRKNKDGDGDIDISKSCPMPHKKKQRQVKAEINASEHEMVQDFIDKQRAYFAEVDAFELEEEVASGNESS